MEATPVMRAASSQMESVCLPDPPPASNAPFHNLRLVDDRGWPGCRAKAPTGHDVDHHSMARRRRHPASIYAGRIEPNLTGIQMEKCADRDSNVRIFDT